MPALPPLVNALLEIAARQRAAAFSDLQGTVITGTFPLRETLVNEAVQAALAEKPMPVRNVEIWFPGGNRIVINATVSLLLFSQKIRLVLDVDELIDFRADPTLRLRIAPESGLTGVLLGVLSKVVSALPEEVTIADRAIRINIQQGLARQGLGDLLPLLHWARVRGVQGCLSIDFRVSVEER